MIDQPPKTGEVLSHDLLTREVELVPMVEQFLYANTSTMLSADPGTGKSTICTQVAATASSGGRLFDRLPAPRPLRVYYISFETTYEEFISQVRTMSPVITLNPANVCWDDGLAGLNIQRPDHVSVLLKRLEAWLPIDLLILEPIYMMISSGMSTDEGGSAIAKCLTALKRHLACSILFTNQTKRMRYTQTSGEAIEEDHPFYGSRWIEAHVHTAYHLSKLSKEHQGVVLRAKKDRLKACLPTLTLAWRPETMTCTMEEEPPSESLQGLLDFLADCKDKGKTTNLYDAIKAVKCSESHMRRLIKDVRVQERVRFQEASGKRTIWELV